MREAPDRRKLGQKAERRLNCQPSPLSEMVQQARAAAQSTRKKAASYMVWSFHHNGQLRQKD